MRAILVRVGVDQAFGGWNAPADPRTGRFVYVPIPETASSHRAGHETRYSHVESALAAFAQETGDARALLPRELAERATHLDPDFEHLTYGDVGDRRGAAIRELVAPAALRARPTLVQDALVGVDALRETRDNA